MHEGNLLVLPPNEICDVLPIGRPLSPQHTLPHGRPACLGMNEPLVKILNFPKFDIYSAKGILESRQFLIRQEVMTRLRQARITLVSGLDLVVLDAWRSVNDQNKLLDYYSAERIDGYVASVSPDAIRPPHTTGGAIDITLSWNGSPLQLGTEFDDFVEASYLHAFEAHDGAVRRLRRLLASVLEDVGLVPYPLEWWHWSYGDDVWGWRNGCPSLYEIYPSNCDPSLTHDQDGFESL